jgi:alpha-D-xyloside xylohydrolase
MLRWIETSVYLPLMRVHGYMSNTEPWNYGEEALAIIAQCLQERYRLQPYIYSYAAAIANEGSTLMRPLVFDFPADTEALQQKYEYMFGKSLLISPVTESNVTAWNTYLPKHTAGWYDYHTGKHYEGGQTVSTAVDKRQIPVFVRGGSILPLADKSEDNALSIYIYPGADATFCLYEDDGETNDYEQGACSRIRFQWDEATHRLTISKREGQFPTMQKSRKFRIILPDGLVKTINYKGKQTVVR